MKRTAIKVKTHAICKNPDCGKEFKKINSFSKFCSNLCMRKIVGYPDSKTPKSKTIAPRKPIAKQSEKRKKDTAIYLKKRIEFLNENPKCQLCNNSATDLHHTYSGKDRNTHYTDEKTFMALCRTCHNNIHNNPIEAREKGYLK